MTYDIKQNRLSSILTLNKLLSFLSCLYVFMSLGIFDEFYCCYYVFVK